MNYILNDVAVYLSRGEKIQAVKAVKAEYGLSLKEAKDTVDAVCQRTPGSIPNAYSSSVSHLSAAEILPTVEIVVNAFQGPSVPQESAVDKLATLVAEKVLEALQGQLTSMQLSIQNVQGDVSGLSFDMATIMSNPAPVYAAPGPPPAGVKAPKYKQPFFT